MAKAPKKKAHYNFVVSDPEWWRRVKIAASVKETSVQTVITALLETWLDEIEKEIVAKYSKS